MNLLRLVVILNLFVFLLSCETTEEDVLPKGSLAGYVSFMGEDGLLLQERSGALV